MYTVDDQMRYEQSNIVCACIYMHMSEYIKKLLRNMRTKRTVNWEQLEVVCKNSECKKLKWIKCKVDTGTLTPLSRISRNSDYKCNIFLLSTGVNRVQMQKARHIMIT
jgi:Arc/MetJ-type ribon-helix-helix transcriptional regulator